MNEGLDPTDGTWIPVLQEYAIWVLDGQTEEGLRRKVERLSEEIALNPVDAHFLLHRAIAYGNLDALDKAMQDYDNVIRLCPDDPVVYHTKGVTLLDQGELRAAVQAFDRAIQLDPSHVESYHLRGMVRVKLGEYLKAVEDFDQTARLDPRNPYVGHDREVAIELAKTNGVENGAGQD